MSLEFVVESETLELVVTKRVCAKIEQVVLVVDKRKKNNLPQRQTDCEEKQIKSKQLLRSRLK